MNIPNTLTMLRFLLIPVFIALFPKTPYLALAIFLLAWITDLLDGYLARKMNCETEFGRFADPLADKLIALTALWLFARSETLPWFFFKAYLLIGILLGIGAVTVYLKDKGKINRAEIFGKFAMGATLFGIISAFFADMIAPAHIAFMEIATAASAGAIPYYGIRFLLKRKK